MRLESELWRKLGKVLGGILVVIIVMVGGIGAAVYSNAGPGEVTDIADARPGQEVRLYGVINSTAEPAFTVVKSGDDWTLGFSTPFLLVDPRDPTDNISVDVSKCQDLDSTYRYESGDTTGSYINGDRITVVGKVIRNETGVRVLVASTVRDGLSEPTSPWVFVFAFGMTALLVGGMFYHSRWKDLRKQRKQHERFVREKAAGTLAEKPAEKEKAPARYAFTDRGPVMNTLGEPLNAVWEPHPLYMSRRRNNATGYVVLAALAIALVLYWAIFLGASTERGPFFMLAFAGAMVAGIVFWYFMSGVMQMAMPSEFAFTSQGAYFRYASKKSPLIRVESVAWDDIKDIPNAEGALAAPGKTRQYTVLKVGETEVWLDLGKDVQKRFIEEWRRRETGTRPKKLEKHPGAGHAVVDPETADGKDVVEWLQNGHDLEKRRGMRKFIISMYLSLAIPLTVVAIVAWNGFLIAIAVIVPIIVALMFWSLERSITFRPLLAVGLSSEGIHFKYGEGQATDHQTDFIPWSNIKMVSPPGVDYLHVYPVERKKEFGLVATLGFRMFGVDSNISDRISQELDRRYSDGLPIHPDRGSAPTTPEMQDNRTFLRARTRLLFPAILLAAAVLGIPVRYYSEIAGMIIILICSSLFIISVIDLVPRNYRLFKTAPEKVGLSSDGIHLSFGRRNTPPGTSVFMGWEELDRMVDFSGNEIGRTGPLTEENGEPVTLYVVKRRGTSRYIGPVDFEIAEEIRKRIYRRG